MTVIDTTYNKYSKKDACLTTNKSTICLQNPNVASTHKSLGIQIEDFNTEIIPIKTKNTDVFDVDSINKNNKLSQYSKPCTLYDKTMEPTSQSDVSRTQPIFRPQLKLLQATMIGIKDKILNILHKLFIKNKTNNSVTNSSDIATKTDLNKIAIILKDYSDDLLNQYINNIHTLGKEAIKFTLNKSNASNKQSFLRLKKQGIKLVTVCSDYVTKKSWRKLSRFNTKWRTHLNKNGLIYVCPDIILNNNLIKTGVITKRVPNEAELRDIALGMYTLNGLLNSKSGQSVIVQAEKVLGIEAEAETTDDLIERCIDLNNNGGILLKVTKVYQQNALDFPVINEKTIKNIHDAKLSGIAINAKYCYIENMQQVIRLANKKNIFIIGI